ncbi:hypothetical protein CCR85_05155 [Rhodothalassium salexigens]|uniref:FkbM family methyltransferase n=1 Tax=Rhodothalassium salexigens TaxID=1086 RepID=UPI001911712F|nr:FkbM family methyltransferase [Rhodothalassium salexigens]MBK5910880.1 hypothetical protein [Rhodothalassium salexigens]MBK5920167.1 hypothetical protein [Rhodothalassium salexigens]
MNDLLQKCQIDGLQDLLSTLTASGIRFRDAVDGGAGSGSTSRAIRDQIEGCVYAAEPFTGNHRFFDHDCDRIILSKSALFSDSGPVPFVVDSTVGNDSDWGKRGMAGYSSLGRIVADPADPKAVTVDAVRGDDMVRAPHDVDFVKLDVQGGELHALKGMPRILKNAKLLWIEFSGNKDLLDFLSNDRYTLFDTAYVFVGDICDKLANEFTFTSTKTSSTNQAFHFGFRKTNWPNYHEKFISLKKDGGLLQTDIVAVDNRLIRPFYAALSA